MGLLERIGLAPKPKRPKPVGNRLETGRETLSKNHKKPWEKVGIFAGLLLVTFFAFPSAKK